MDLTRQQYQLVKEYAYHQQDSRYSKELKKHFRSNGSQIEIWGERPPMWIYKAAEIPINRPPPPCPISPIKIHNDIENKYHELLFAVESKFPNETRHQTALRYIREAESQCKTACCQGGKSLL